MLRSRFGFRYTFTWTAAQFVKPNGIFPYGSTTQMTTARGYKVARKGSGKAPTVAGSLSLSTSCSDTRELESLRPKQMTALQRRQQLMKDKAAFTLTANAIYRVKILLGEHNMRAFQIEKEESKAKQAVTFNTTNVETVGSATHIPKTIEQANDYLSQHCPWRLATGIRVNVKRRGCSGYSYTVNYCYAADNNDSEKIDEVNLGPKSSNGFVEKKSFANRLLRKDTVVQQAGVEVRVADEALFYVIGTVMDYTTSNVESKFVFKNPNEKHACGCGESFMPFDV